MSKIKPCFTYLSSDGILHLHDEEHAAQSGKHVQTSLTDDESGFPDVEGQGIAYYACEGKAYVKGNKNDSQLIPKPLILKQLAAELL
ncbi:MULTISPECIES: hypothetical protein [Paenibacillus]|uniref:hypothetical protein n=1 Tax=Paenibacillus TaxID=44249 RepID=UPI0002DCD87A|nr:MULTISPECIES: hypothetical protein [Paenibacillus]KKD53947.1 hypothetical protein C400_16060 [Paenibacillus sp. ICGEB2008]